MGEAWGVDKPLRKDEERRAAQVEIDAIVAMSLGETADELCMIYRTQFPVMRRYDQEDRFDANGRKVPKDVLKLQAKLFQGEELSVVDRTWVHPQSSMEYVCEYPFRQLEREAYARFFRFVSASHTHRHPEEEGKVFAVIERRQHSTNVLVLYHSCEGS